MNPDLLVFGFIQYIVFLFSTTCHEAAHALIAKLGGDTTAFEGGQVSLNPLPHIKREPFGMVLLPIIGIVSGTGLIGWASAPYDPLWSQRHPKRAAWMSLAGPATNFILAILAGILMRVGLALSIFTPGVISPAHIVVGPPGGVTEGVAVVVSILFSLNLLLGCFNLLPFPPLDGYGVLGLFTNEAGALKLQDFRMKIRSFSIIGLLIGWRLIDHFYQPLLAAAVHGVYAFYRFS
ncbi:MAG: site-2 protease family protein [Acidobacteriota bacterium]|nr:site-2 protease family protein [Acidobacteriota bacterium]